MAIPLTSQEHIGSWYVPFEFNKKRQVAVLCQARVLSSSRLYQKMGEISKSDLKLIEAAFKKLY